MEPSPAGRPGQEGEARLLAALLLLLLLALAGAVAGVAYLPTHDGPQHVFTAHAAAHLDAPGRGWAEWLTPNVPVTNHGFTALFAPFDAWLPWPLALRAALTLTVLLWAGGAIAFVRAVHPGRLWLALPLAAAACQWSLYMGFFSFHAASGLGLWVLALAFGRRRWSAAFRVGLALLLLLQALMHVFPAVLTGALVACLALARAQPGARARALAGVACVGAPAALVAAATLRIGFSALGDYNEGAGGSAVLAPGPWWAVAYCFTAGPAWRAWALPLLGVGSLALTLRRGLRAEDRALALGGAGLLLAALSLPLHLRAWDFFSVRWLPLGVCALVALTPIERVRQGPARRALAAGFALWAFAATGWAWQHNRDLAERMAPALRGLDVALARDGMRLPIVMDPYLGASPEVPFAVPALNLGALYAASQGGVVPDLFTVNPVLHYALRREAAWRSAPGAVDRSYAIDLADPERDAAFRRAVLAYLASRATQVQDVILWGHEADAEQLLAMGFRADFRAGGLLLAHFEGCPLTVRVQGADARESLVVGWYPAWHVSHRYPLARGRAAPDGALELRLRQSCGAVWLGFEDRELACAGADAEGHLVVASPRDTPEVSCRVRHPALAAR